MVITHRRATESGLPLVKQVFSKALRFCAALPPQRFQMVGLIIISDWLAAILADEDTLIFGAEADHYLRSVLMLRSMRSLEDPIPRPRGIDSPAYAET